MTLSYECGGRGGLLDCCLVWGCVLFLRVWAAGRLHPEAAHICRTSRSKALDWVTINERTAFSVRFAAARSRLRHARAIPRRCPKYTSERINAQWPSMRETSKPFAEMWRREEGNQQLGRYAITSDERHRLLASSPYFDRCRPHRSRYRGRCFV